MKNRKTDKDTSVATGLAQPIVDPSIEGVEHRDASGAPIPSDASAKDESIDLTVDDGNKGPNSGTAASDDEITQKIDLPPPEALDEAGAKPGDEQTTDDISSAGLGSSGSKWLLGGAAAVIAFGLIVGYFVTRARPDEAARVAQKPPISAPTTPAQPGMEIKVPLPTGVDATDCRPDQVVVDQANHALLYPASCSKIIFARPAQ